MKESQHDNLKRKIPLQQRAITTCETILDATAQILAEKGSEALTTNYLAERAGFSIGTIYQYFPNREAIVVSLINRQREKMAQQIQLVIEQEDLPSEIDKIRAIIHTLHMAFNIHRQPQPKLVQSLIKFSALNGLPNPPHVAAKTIVKLWVDADPENHLPLGESEQFVLNQSILEVFRQAALNGSALLGTQAFEDAIFRLVIGFLSNTSTNASGSTD